MLFNSYVFILRFLPIVLIGYFFLNKYEKYVLAKIWLIISSFYFYAYFNSTYLLIIISSITVNYVLSQIMLKTDIQIYRKFAFAMALVANIGSLFFFKYYDFFISNINALFHSEIRLFHIMLPLGISFFTFQQLSYVIDSYHRVEGIEAYNFVDYALFVTFFPQLVAGPIVTHDEMVPQFADLSKKHFDMECFGRGIYAFTLGLAKKVLIADALGKAVDIGFSDVGSLSTGSAIVVMLAYSLQIYFDFSGYCDMATGIGLMMNINITKNFNSPYKAISIIDFWKRWHITLTRFFTKYIYIPLGGNRKGTIKTYMNVFIVFLVSGIWHGANWTFILWGGVHGIAQIITRIIDKKTGFFSIKQKRSVKVFQWATTFAFVNLAWVLFRAESLSQAVAFYKQIFGFSRIIPDPKILGNLYPSVFDLIIPYIPYSARIVEIFMVAFSVIAATMLKNTNEKLDSFVPSVKKGVCTACLMTVCIISLAGVSSFLYWNF